MFDRPRTGQPFPHTGRFSPSTALFFAILSATGLMGCHDSSRKPPITTAGEDMGPGFSSTVTLVVTSEGTSETLTVASVDEAAGVLGVVGGPLDIDAPIGDTETIAVDEANRRIYVGSDINASVAVVEMDGAGVLTPIAGSPFPLEAAEPTAVVLNTTSNVAYVGYRHLSFISRYPLDPSTGAVGSPLAPVPVSGNFIETMRPVGDLLYVICSVTSNILAFRIETDGTLTDLGVNVVTDPRPDYIDFVSDGMGGFWLYVSTTSGTLDGYDIDLATGALTRLPGAPYTYPGLTSFELLRATPDGAFIAVGTELTPSVALFRVEPNGSLTAVNSVSLSTGAGGPEGIVWSPNGRFLFVANHVVGGIFVYELVGDALFPGPVPRYLLPGRAVDLGMTGMGVTVP